MSLTDIHFLIAYHKCQNVNQDIQLSNEIQFSPCHAHNKDKDKDKEILFQVFKTHRKNM